MGWYDMYAYAKERQAELLREAERARAIRQVGRKRPRTKIATARYVDVETEAEARHSFLRSLFRRFFARRMVVAGRIDRA